jgi:hypothetical protein
MTIEINRAIARKAREADPYALAEVEMHYQFDIAGEPGSGTNWNEISVTFTEVLYDAPGQTTGDNPEPQVSFGYVIETADPVAIFAHVSDWDIDDEGNFVGATVRCGCFDPDGEAGRFTGALHVTFKGLGAPADTEEGTEVQ